VDHPEQMMSHREKSLTPWITNETHGDLPPAHFDGTRWSDDDPKTDREKHEFCRRRTGVCATFLSPSLYAKAESLGYDMRNFVINKSIPVVLSPGEVSLDNGKTWYQAPHGATFTVEHKMPTNEERRAELQRKLDNGELLGASHNMDFKGPVYGNGSFINPDGSEYKRGPLEVSKLAPSHAVRWDDCAPAPKLYPHGKVGRKHISEKTCGGKDVVCMPGLDGKCVACSDDD
jgi:hypothetical protein